MGILRQRKKKKSIYPKLIILLLIVWAGSGIYLSLKATKKAEKLTPAEKELKILRTIKFFPSYSRELTNLNAIIFDKGQKSEKHGWILTCAYKKILNNLLLVGNLDKFKKTIEYLSEDGTAKEKLPFYYGLYLFNKGEFEKAKPFLNNNKEFEKIYSSGKIQIIDGLLTYDIKEKKYTAKYRGMKFLENIFPAKRDFLVTYNSTIVPEVQDIAETVIGNREGFFAIARQGRVLAIVANGVNPFNDYVEPGSVIKLVTFTGYVSEHRKDIKFPFYCEKPINIDGKAFYDWKKHGKIPSMEEALACSCNLVFGESGLSLGKTTLLKWYSRFYIDNNKTLTVCEHTFNPGKTKEEITNRYLLAEAGIGLAVPSVTPYWLLKTASTFARNGRDSIPSCVDVEHFIGNPKWRTAVSNMVFSCDKKKDYVFNFKEVKPVYNGMFKAVELPIGTGRRAKTEGIKLFLKTGTAGKKPYNAFIIGFAEYKNGNYGFALYLKNGGKAEYAAAETIHNFFKSFKNLN